MRRSLRQENNSELIIPKEFKNNSNLFSNQAFEEHLKLYHGYIDKINEKTNKASIDSYNMNGYELHNLFFENIEYSETDISIKNNTIEYLNSKIENWQDEFINIAKQSRGWTILAYIKSIENFKIISMESHDKGLIFNSIPLIVFDAYEHSFMIDYLTNKNDYIQKFLECINWDIVAQRIKNLN